MGTGEPSSLERMNKMLTDAAGPPTSETDKALERIGGAAKEALNRERLREKMRQHLTEPGTVLLKEVGTMGSTVGEPEIKAVEALSRDVAARSAQVRAGGSILLGEKARPEDHQFITLMGGKQIVADDLHEIAAALQHSAVEARQVMKDDNIVNRALRTVRGRLP